MLLICAQHTFKYLNDKIGICSKFMRECLEHAILNGLVDLLSEYFFAFLVVLELQEEELLVVQDVRVQFYLCELERRTQDFFFRFECDNFN